MANDELSARAEEHVRLGEAVDQRISAASGLVAVLDALGTKALSLEEAVEFVRRRELSATFAGNVVETSLPGLQVTRLKRFTFNDTVIFVYTPPGSVTLQEVGLIRFRGHLPKGGYDVQTDGRAPQASASPAIR